MPLESRTARISSSLRILIPYSSHMESTLSSSPSPYLISDPIARTPPGERTLDISATPFPKSGQKK